MGRAVLKNIVLSRSWRYIARRALIALCVMAGHASAQDLRTFSSREFRFAFKYPESWSVQPPGSPNSRAKVATPKDAPHAECAVIVQRYPQLSSLRQAQIDQIFSQKPSPSEIQQSLSQGFSDVAVLATSVGALDFLPAHLARVRYRVETEAGKVFVSARVVSTATPGLTWTVVCGGQGRSFDEAEKSYEHWQAAINNVLFSFRFLHRSARPSR